MNRQGGSGFQSIINGAQVNNFIRYFYFIDMLLLPSNVFRLLYLIINELRRVQHPAIEA